LLLGCREHAMTDKERRIPGKNGLKIKVIAEGSTPEQRRRGIWGLSLLVGNHILFDTFGHPEIFRNNITTYGINTKEISAVVISHAHWDHISGLKGFLFKSRAAIVYVPEKSVKIEGVCREAGVMTGINERPKKIGDGIYLTGGMGAVLKKEKFKEQAVLVKGRKGYVLIAGCSHPGILRMIRRAKKIIKGEIYAVVGGLHLKDAESAKIMKIVSEIRALGVKKVVAGHCTGKLAVDCFEKVFKGGFKTLKEGKTYSF
jgi:7,8-dihydropterin-6-yl-methyl-4-(beta-D-ribofuranosyl)aminobenzene 5'-phosphate synthase